MGKGGSLQYKDLLTRACVSISTTKARFLGRSKQGKKPANRRVDEEVILHEITESNPERRH